MTTSSGPAAGTAASAASGTGADFRSRVEAALPGLSAAAQRVALELLDERSRLGFHSASEIARRAGASDATVIRTVQALGYRGLIELKSAIAGELTPPGPTERMRQSIHHTAGALRPAETARRLQESITVRIAALRQLAEPDVLAAIERSIVLLDRAKRVHVHARGVSAGIADHVAAQFGRIGLDARVLGGPPGVTADDVLSVRRGDALALIASGSTDRRLTVLQQHAAEVGARTMLLTDTIVPLDRETVVVRSGRGQGRAFASHVPTLAVIESIVIGIAARHPARTTQRLDHLERLRARLERAT